MGLLGLIGVVLVLVGAYELIMGAILFGIIVIVVGLVIASWGGGTYYRGRRVL